MRIKKINKEKLKKIKETIFSDEIIDTFLAKELTFLDASLFSETKKANTDFLIGNIDGIKLLICILEKLPKSSYGILLSEVSDFYNSLLVSKLGVKKISLSQTAIQFTPRKIDTDSRLAKIKDQNLKN